jgi:hypothetical protein
MVKRILIGLVAALYMLSGAVTYQAIPLDRSNSYSFATVLTGLTPSALAGTVGVQSQNFTFTGVIHATDGAIGWNLLAGQNTNCPLVSVRIPSDNTFAFDFLNMLASPCTPNAGTYVVVVMRVGAAP